MKIIAKKLATTLLAGASACAFISIAHADTNSANQIEGKIQSLEKQIQDLSNQVSDMKRNTKDQNAEVQKQQAAATKVTIANGRPTIASADGNFTASIRGLMQLDWGYYSQGAGAKSLPTAYGPDLSSGTNLRRVFLGLQGKVFGDWSYYFLYDFGGASTETPGHIMYSYLQYDGLAPWAFRIGAYAPPTNIEDSTAAADLMFFERNSPSNLQRGIAGSESRDAITVFYTGERLFGALSFTGNKLSDGAKALAAAGATAAPNYDEQMSLVGRLSYLPVSTDNARWLVGVNGLYVIKPPDSVANGAATLSTTPGATAKNSITLADTPEISIDSNGTYLANTGSMPANHISQWGVETAGNYQNFYGQAGYYGFAIDRAPVAYTVYSDATTSATSIVHPSNNGFTAWYIQGSWILTGESKGYNPAMGAFTAPKVAQPFSLTNGGWGAWELAARYSDLNLNDHVNDPSNVITNWTGTANKTYTYYNTVRGGDQKIVTLGLNWYVNNGVRFALDYQWIDVSRMQAPAAVTTTGTPVLPTVNGGQKVQTIALRTQIAI